MRIKLSYTVDEEDVLAEAAKILGLGADDMQQCILLFKGVQDDLTGNDEEGAVANVHRALEKIEEFRKALLNVDTRLSEVVDIVQSYEDFRASKSRPTPRPGAASPGLLVEEGQE
tara:strand:- start:1054 stop:1398 length:345 start_codon:yes stop_codon:yes gene_type:complete